MTTVSFKSVRFGEYLYAGQKCLDTYPPIPAPTAWSAAALAFSSHVPVRQAPPLHQAQQFQWGVSVAPYPAYGATAAPRAWSAAVPEFPPHAPMQQIHPAHQAQNFQGDTSVRLQNKHVLLSGRFDGGHKERVIRELYAALKQNHPEVNPYIVAASGGQTYGDQTAHGLLNMYAMVCVMFEDYGEQTDSPYCSFQEVKFAFENSIPRIPVSFVKPLDYPPRQGEASGRNRNRMAFPCDLVTLDWSDKKYWDPAECAAEVARALEKHMPSHAQDSPGQAAPAPISIAAPVRSMCRGSQ